MSVSFAPGVETPAPGVEAPATGVEMPATVSRGRRLIRQATRLTGFASSLLKGARIKSLEELAFATVVCWSAPASGDG